MTGEINSFSTQQTSAGQMSGDHPGFPRWLSSAKGEETRQRREAATSPIQDQSGDARHTSSFAAT